MNFKTFQRAFISTLPVFAGYIVLGFGFGILLRVAGFGALWALMMAVSMYAGSMQYVGVSLLASGASFITVAITTLMVQARHLFYGVSLIDRYRGAGIKKIYLMHALTDETYALVSHSHVPDFADAHSYYFIVSLLNHCYWITGCVLGSLAGAIIPFNSKGIDFSMTALFVTVFVEQWLTTKNHWPALIGLAASGLCLVIFGADKFLLPTMVVITIALLLMKKSAGGETHE